MTPAHFNTNKTIHIIPAHSPHPSDRSPSHKSTRGRRKKLRVAAYARVSTSSEEQQNSFANQVNYYSTYIQNHKQWILKGIYSDEGISGLSTKARKGFNQMLKDAEAGQIDLIITKSISRFARNMLDAIYTIRRLKALRRLSSVRREPSAAFSQNSSRATPSATSPGTSTKIIFPPREGITTGAPLSSLAS